MILKPDSATPHRVAIAFDRFFTSNPSAAGTWPIVSISEFTYGVGARRLTRQCAFTSTFKVLAHWDPIKDRVVRGPVPFKSYCS